MAGGVPGPGWPDARTTVVGVMGDPVRHSLSPLLHNAAFAALGLNWISVGVRGVRRECCGGARRYPCPRRGRGLGDDAAQR